MHIKAYKYVSELHVFFIEAISISSGVMCVCVLNSHVCMLWSSLHAFALYGGFCYEHSVAAKGNGVGFTRDMTHFFLSVCHCLTAQIVSITIVL